MFSSQERHRRRWYAWMAAALVAPWLGSCGGGTAQDSGPNKTYLSVEATDPDGDTLQYQWRVTAGSIENRNARETVWTMPDGPGVHFAYVVVSDGKGGYVEQQYAVSTDALETAPPSRPAREYIAKDFTDVPENPDAGGTARLRYVYSTGAESTKFGKELRYVYMPDMVVEVRDTNGTTKFSGRTDLSGELSLPFLRNGDYTLFCSTSTASAPVNCGGLTINDKALVPRKMTLVETPKLGPERNLRLYGHIAFTGPDGGVCGIQNDFFGLQKAATVQLLQADGTALTPAKRVNRFGDYALDAAVPVHGKLMLQVECEGYNKAVEVLPKTDDGFLSTSLVELSHTIGNQRPRIVKMVANGPEGNVRGRMVVPETGVQSNGMPGPDQFLAYKGKDTPLSACKYYESLGAVKSCDAQGRMNEPISFDDWKRKHKFGTGKDVSANYINKMDLNLVRRMVATEKKSADNTSTESIAFYVCNNPGPEGRSQAEVDDLLSRAVGGEFEVACVAMEWSVSKGVNGNLPITKFLTFGPDGSLIPSVNLDGRGEKFMPGACVACHGGSKFNGRFPESGAPSPNIGSRFLPFDLSNFLFGSDAGLTKSAQNDALRELNFLVKATERYYAADDSATSKLIDGWYSDDPRSFNTSYVGSAWKKNKDEEKFYREVIGTSCRTCHTALGKDFNWDAINWMTSEGTRGRNIDSHACGGGADIALNATMPNALITRDRITERAQADSELARLMKTYLGCTTPNPDPGGFPRR